MLSIFTLLGAPEYALVGRLQVGKRIDKRSDQARVGIYVGSSQNHARLVAVVLSMLIGMDTI